MLLKKLSLQNFRPFKGNHEILFSLDENKNVTLVMAENGAGKTTLAQAFQWALYGRSDGFKVKSSLNKLVEQELEVGQSALVKVELELKHNNVDYIITRTQNYTKDNSGLRPDNSKLDICQKNKDGQTEYITDIKKLSTISNILPETLSKYFFFDGERIEKMASDVSSGKSEDFKEAVQNILGLTALLKAIEHLHPNQATSVIGRFNTQIDQYGDEKTRANREIIYKNSEKLETNTTRIEKLEEELVFYNKEVEDLKIDIASYAEYENIQKQVNALNYKLDKLKQQKNTNIITFMQIFSKDSRNYFSRKPMQDALIQLKETGNIDKGIPDIRDTTIDFLIKRKRCICGSDLSDATSNEFKELIKLLDFIPPQSIGTSLSQFTKFSNMNLKSSQTYFNTAKSALANIRSVSNEIDDIQNQISEADQTILKADDNKISDLKRKQLEYQQNINNLNEEKIKIEAECINLRKAKAEAEAELSKLQLQIKKNKDLEIKRQYALAAYNKLDSTYKIKEEETRKMLEEEINELFKNIYADGMTITVDEKYRIKTLINKLTNNDSNVDANTARSYSVIFAFVVGIIGLAKNKLKNDDDFIEDYPLVMDAPLSSFDQRRIKNICEVIPEVGNQVIIFIKDTDGNIAKENLQEKIGLEYIVALEDKNVPLSSTIKKVGV